MGPSVYVNLSPVVKMIWLREPPESGPPAWWPQMLVTNLSALFLRADGSSLAT
jgi:hypothetical protein